MADLVLDRSRLEALCDQYGIATLEVFGSVARGDERPGSDIDLLYTLRPGRLLGWEIEELSDALTEVFARPVDLVSRRALNARLREDVLRDARELYAAA